MRRNCAHIKMWWLSARLWQFHHFVNALGISLVLSNRNIGMNDCIFLEKFFPEMPGNIVPAEAAEGARFFIHKSRFPTSLDEFMLVTGTGFKAYINMRLNNVGIIQAQTMSMENTYRFTMHGSHFAVCCFGLAQDNFTHMLQGWFTGPGH